MISTNFGGRRERSRGGDEALERESWSCGCAWGFVLIRWKVTGREKDRLDGLEMGLEKKERSFGVVKSRTAEEREVAMAAWLVPLVQREREREREVCGEKSRRESGEEKTTRETSLDILRNEPRIKY